MDQKPPINFASPLLSGAAVCYALAALLGIPGVILIFSSDYAAFLLQDLLASGITDASSLRTWRIINSVVTLIACLGPCILAAGLGTALLSRPYRGVHFLGTTAQALLWSVNVGGGILLAVIIFRLVRFTVACLESAKYLMSFYSMVISEGLMIALSVFLFVMLRKFLDSCIDTATSLGYTLATGKLDSRSIPGFPATCFLIFAILGLFLAANRILTITVGYNSIYNYSYYKLLVSQHPAQWIEAACLILGSAANILMFRYLRRCKHEIELALFETRKIRKNR